MQQLVETLRGRFGLQVGDLLGLAVALAGCVVATVVALRVPLSGALGDVGGAPPPVAGPVVAGVATGAGGGLTEVGAGAAIVVHVTGAVGTPGVVTLPSGARVTDALHAAGGASPDADLGRLNLARQLVDGEQVVVPTIVAGGAAEGDGAGDAAAAAPTDGRLPDGRLDLNTATAVQLEELPGVGPVLAGRIVDHREANGPFVTAAALREVSGIGEATWLRLRDLVGVA